MPQPVATPADAAAAIFDLAPRHAAGRSIGITSICSAHPWIVEAALCEARDRDREALIEATCNQVNQDGGYTGMTPEVFRDFVQAIAASVGFPRDRIILGGDHLGPNPWRHLPAAEAMAKAEMMVATYAAAGFRKLHLDTSMGCAGEPGALDDATTADRAATLAAVAERAAPGKPLAYVLGTEVPVPGGADQALHALDVTSAEAARHTIAVHRQAFAARGLAEAFARVVAIVVQPGVEFGNDSVIRFRPEAARQLSAVLDEVPSLVFEAHSTDYQPPFCLRALVEQGFAILKVGPALSFALREALYGLDAIADLLDPRPESHVLRQAMERLMCAEPEHWRRYCGGSAEEQKLQRHFGYSDRIRYYWSRPPARAAVADLLQRLEGRVIPETLISQWLNSVYPAVAAGDVAATPHHLVIAAIRGALAPYSAACA